MTISFREQRQASTEVEVKCDACNGTGFQAINKAAQSGRRIYPATCPRCVGKGRVRNMNEEFRKQRARTVRALAEKAGPFTKKRSA